MDGKEMEAREERVRQRAYEIWQREGCPEGRAEEHWQMARTEIAMSEDQATATRPAPRARRRPTRPDNVEPIEAVENLGSFPTMTDQDEEQGAPKRKSRPKLPKPHKD
jgi:hypothetical protein